MNPVLSVFKAHAITHEGKEGREEKEVSGGGSRAVSGRTGGVRGCSPLTVLPEDALGRKRGAARKLCFGLEDHDGSWVMCTDTGT